MHSPNIFLWMSLLAVYVQAQGMAKIKLITENNNTTLTKGFAIVQKNDSIRLQCRIVTQMQGHLSDRLKFKYNSISDDVVTEVILDEHTIELTIRNISKSNEFICKYNNKNMDLVEIVVGNAPEKSISFTCRSFALLYMRCRLESTKNDVTTSRTVRFKTFSRHGNCEFSETDPNVCIIPEAAYPMAQEKFVFIVEQKNVFGSLTENFMINNFASVVPAEVEHLRATTVSTTSANLVWDIPTRLCDFQEGLIYKVSYKSQYDDDWTDSITESTHLQLINLQFGNANYAVRVTCKVKIADHSPYMWSQAAELQFRTLPGQPESVQTDGGAFYINDNNEITVYWKELISQMKHSPTVDYTIRMQSCGESNSYFNSTSFSSNLGQLPTGSNNVLISSRNSAGVSLPVLLTIPGERVSKPRHLRKMLAASSSPSLVSKYRLSWSAPETGENVNISSYTVFWCASQSEGKDQCQSGFNFTRLDADQTWFELESSQTINFAVSANTDTSSSGMVWTRCTSKADGHLHKLDIMKCDSGACQWLPNCIDEGLLQGFLLKICRSSCEKGQEQTMEINDPNQRSFAFSESNSREELHIEIAGVSIRNREIGPYTTKRKPAALSMDLPVYVSVAMVLVLFFLLVFYTVIVYVIPIIKSMKNIELYMPDSLFDQANTPRTQQGKAFSVETLNNMTEPSEKYQCNRAETIYNKLSCDSPIIVEHKYLKLSQTPDVVDAPLAQSRNASLTRNGYVPINNLWPNMQGYVTQNKLSQ